MTSQNRCGCIWACSAKWGKRNIRTAKRQTRNAAKKIHTQTYTDIHRARITCCLHVTAHYFFLHFFLRLCRFQVVALSCHCLYPYEFPLKRMWFSSEIYVHIYLYKSCFITSNISSSFGNFLFCELSIVYFPLRLSTNLLCSPRCFELCFSEFLLLMCFVVSVRFYEDKNQKTSWFFFIFLKWEISKC